MSAPTPEQGDLELIWYLLGCGSVDAGSIRYDIGLDFNKLPYWIDRLTRLGCDVSQTGTTQYQLNRVGIELWQDYLEFALTKEGLSPPHIRVFRETSSTQDQAKQFAPDYTLVLTDQQTAGRGRVGRHWLSAPGASVLMSLCWPVQGLSVSHDRLSMLIGVAVAQTTEQLIDGAVRLKWPNDVMVDGVKLAGILIESVQDAYIIGIGLNVTRDSLADPSLSGTATCLMDHGFQADRLYVIQQIMFQINKTLRLHDHQINLDEWRSRAALGQTQTFEHSNQRITGEVVGLDPDHGLIVRRDSGEMITLPAATTSVVK